MNISDSDDDLNNSLVMQSTTADECNTIRPKRWIWCSICKVAVHSRRWASHHRLEHYKNAITDNESIKRDKLELEFESSEHIKNLLDSSSTTFSELLDLTNHNVVIANRLKEWLTKKHFTVSQTTARPRKRKLRHCEGSDPTEPVLLGQANMITEITQSQDTQHGDLTSVALSHHGAQHDSFVNNFDDSDTFDPLPECTYPGSQYEELSLPISESCSESLCHPDFENPYNDGKGLTGQRARMYQMGLYDRVKLKSSSILQLLLKHLLRKQLNERRCTFITNRCAQVFAFIRKECNLMEYGYDMSFGDITSNKDVIIQFLDNVETIYSADCRHNYESALLQFVDLVYATKDLPQRVECAIHSFHRMLTTFSSYSQLTSDRLRYLKRNDAAGPRVSYDDITSMFECDQIKSAVLNIRSKSFRQISFEDATFYAPYLAGRFAILTGNRFEVAYKLRITDWENKVSCPPDGFGVSLSVAKQGIPHCIPISNQTASDMQFYVDNIRPKYVKNNSESSVYFFINTSGSQFLGIGASFRLWQLKHFEDIRSFTIGCNISRHVITTYRKNLRLTHTEYMDIGAVLGNSDPVQLKYYTDTIDKCTVRGLVAINYLFSGQPPIDCSNVAPDDDDDSDRIIDLCTTGEPTGSLNASYNTMIANSLVPTGAQCASNIVGPLGPVLKNSAPIVYNMTPVEQLIRARFQLYPCLSIIHNLSGRGTGVFATQFMPKGTWVSNYQGKWIPDKVHNARIEKLLKTDIKEAEHIQMYRMHIPNLKMFIEAHEECRIPGITSIGRLFNHSCLHPNVEAIQKPINLPDGSIVCDILFRALKDIQANDEIFWYYGNSRDFDHADWWKKCWCNICNVKGHGQVSKGDVNHPSVLVPLASGNICNLVHPVRKDQVCLPSESQKNGVSKLWCGTEGFRLYYTEKHRRNILTVQNVPGTGNLCAVESIYRALVSASVTISWEEVYKGLCNETAGRETENFEIITVISFLIKLGKPFAFIHAPSESQAGTVWYSNVTDETVASKIAGIVYRGDHYVYTVPFEHPGYEKLDRKINWTRHGEIKDFLPNESLAT